MNAKQKVTSAAAAVMLFGAAGADAALQDGFTPPTWDTSVFVSVVERNAVNQVVRNMVLDTGATTMDFISGTPWSTSAAQEASILGFIGSINAGSTVKFNLGGALNQQDWSSDLMGFITSGDVAGPGSDSYSALDTGIGKINSFIAWSNQGNLWDANGVLPVSSGPSNPGWHNFDWGDVAGGALAQSNEILFGTASQVTGWRLDFYGDYSIDRSVHGPLTSDLQSGDISFNAAVVPLPGAVWLFGSAIGLAGAWRRRAAA